MRIPVRAETYNDVLANRRIIHILARTVPEDIEEKVAFSESRIGTAWMAFYNCQDFASEVAKASTQSFQREGVLAACSLGSAWVRQSRAGVDGSLLLGGACQTRH
jgi:hypothetical protein